MSDNTFARLMGQIGAEAEQQQLDEQRAAARRVKMRAIRKRCLALLGVLAIAWAWVNLIEIGQRLSAAVSPPSAVAADAASADAPTGDITAQSVTANGGKNFKFLQEQAKIRDEALADLSK